MADEPLLIKKYGNRRLYDTEASQYITLEDLARRIKSGRDVRVVDAKTNKEITKSVLLQIITENEKDHDLFPVSFLKKMIQLSDHAVADSLHRYLRVSLDAFLSAQKEFEDRYKSFAGTLVNPLGSMGSLGGMNPLIWPMTLFGKGEEGPPSAAEPSPEETASSVEEESSPAEPESTQDQLKQLQEQMAQMQAVIQNLQKKK